MIEFKIYSITDTEWLSKEIINIIKSVNLIVPEIKTLSEESQDYSLKEGCDPSSIVDSLILRVEYNDINNFLDSISLFLLRMTTNHMYNNGNYETLHLIYQKLLSRDRLQLYCSFDTIPNLLLVFNIKIYDISEKWFLAYWINYYNWYFNQFETLP